jgi:hypothetical protein
MPKVVTLELGMRATPPEAAARVRAAVDQGGGAILDAARLSNKALTYRVEVALTDLPRLEATLAALGSVIKSAVHEYEGRAEADAADATMLLHVALVHREPDQRVELPKVPG